MDNIEKASVVLFSRGLWTETYYIGIMSVADYWFRFEWQHRGSPHVHGVAWVEGAPDAEQVLVSTDNNAKQQFVEYMDKVVSTMNPGVLPDGSDVDTAPPAQVNPHICNLPYDEVQNFNEDLLLHANVTPGVQLPTVCVPLVVKKSADLAIPSHSSLQQRSPPKMMSLL